MALRHKERKQLALNVIVVVALVAVAAIFAMLGRNLTGSGTITGAATSTGPLLTVTPNPCPLPDEGYCQALVRWDAHGVGQVWVSMVNGPEQLFGCGEGLQTERAPWIGKEVLTFTLYAADSCEPEAAKNEPLASVVATGVH